MSTYALEDSATMLRRNLLHMRRYPSLALLIIGMPVVFLLLFVYVFGGTLGSGLGSAIHVAATGRAAYANYVAPAIILLTAAAVAQGTAISVASDMTQGIIARFRTMAIAPSSVLTGHVLGSLIQAVAGMAVVTGIAVGVGFRPTASAVEWLAAAGLLVLLALAFTWLTVALGLAAKSVETASNSPMFLLLLPFLGSGFVPTSSMPAGLRWFAQYQPFTPVTNTLRGLLTGGGIGHQGWLAVGWCVAIIVGSYVWSRSLYRRRPSR
jgi:ABC-2 type transport system permease protein